MEARQRAPVQPSPAAGAVLEDHPREARAQPVEQGVEVVIITPGQILGESLVCTVAGGFEGVVMVEAIHVELQVAD